MNVKTKLKPGRMTANHNQTAAKAGKMRAAQINNLNRS